MRFLAYGACASLMAAGILAGQQRASSALRFSVQPACVLQDVRSSISSRNGNEISGFTEFRFLLRTSKTGGAGAIRARFEGSSGQASLRSRIVDAAGEVTSAEITAVGPAEIIHFGPDSHTTRTGSTGRLDWTVTVDPGSQPATPPALLDISCF